MASNNLIYKVTRERDGIKAAITIRLNDECKNGHQDFAITANLYEYDAARDRWINTGGGCCHAEILRIAPEFEKFVKLHLCDYLGRPMYAVENGFYHLKNGFNQTAIDAPEFAEKFCEYYRITAKQFKILKRSETALQYSIKLQALNILDQLQTEAAEAIKELESLTGETFLVDSVRSQYTAPSMAEIEAENERIKSGYYSAKSKRDREAAKIEAEIEKMRQGLDAKLAKAKLEFDVKTLVLRIGGAAALKACIFYTHTNTLAFNWTSWDQISETEAQRIIDKIKKSRLPKDLSGLKFEIKNGQ